MIENVTNRRDWFRQWICGYAVPTEGLALFRIVFAGYVLLFILPTYGWIAEAPPAFYAPPRYSLGILFDSFPHAVFLHALSIAVIALYVALFVGFRTRVTSILITVIIILGNSFSFSFGKINHSFIVDFLPFALAFSPWGDAYSMDALRRRGHLGPPAPGKLSLSNAWPVALTALVIGFGYFSAGFEKAPIWFDLNTATHGARSWLIRGFFQTGRVEYLADFFLRLDNRWFWEVVDLLALALELGFLLAVVHVRAFRAFVLIAVGFHLANYLMLNIDFSGLYVVYLLFIPSSLVLSRLDLVRLERRLAWIARPRFAVALLTLCITSYGAFEVFRVWQGSMQFSPLAVLAEPIGLDLKAVIKWSRYLAGLACSTGIVTLIIRDARKQRSRTAAPAHHP